MRIILWLLVHNTLENMLYKILNTLFPQPVCSVFGIQTHLNIFRKYSQDFPRSLWWGVGDLQKSLAIFSYLQKGSGDWWRCSKMFGWYLLIFRKVRVIFGSARKTSSYLQLSSECISWTPSTFKMPRITFGSHECLCANFRYLHCNL